MANRNEMRRVLLYASRGSPTATNVDLLVVVVLVLSPNAFSFRNRSLLSFAYSLVTDRDTDILHNRTVSDFKVKS